MLKKLKTKILRKLSSGLQWFLKYGEKPAVVQFWVKGSIEDRNVTGTLGTMLKVRNEGGEEYMAVSQAVNAQAFWDAWHAWRDEDTSITWEDGTELKQRDFYAQR